MSQFPFGKHELTPAMSMENQLIPGPGQCAKGTDRRSGVSNILLLAGCAVSEDSVFTASWVREKPRGHTQFRIQLSNHPLVQTWACHIMALISPLYSSSLVLGEGLSGMIVSSYKEEEVR